MSAVLQTALVGHLSNLAYSATDGREIKLNKGAFVGNRTRDLSLTKTALYRLSYEGMFSSGYCKS